MGLYMAVTVLRLQLIMLAKLDNYLKDQLPHAKCI